jgi:hypothetical protein
MESLVLGESGERDKLEKEREREGKRPRASCLLLHECTWTDGETGESLSMRRISKADERGTAKLAGEQGGEIIRFTELANPMHSVHQYCGRNVTWYVLLMLTDESPI